MSVLDLACCILAGIIVIPGVFLPFVIEAGKRDGTIKTGHGDDTDEA